MKADCDRKLRTSFPLPLRTCDGSASVKKELRAHFFPSFLPAALAEHFIKGPPSEGDTLPPLFFAESDSSVASKQAISHCTMSVFPLEATTRLQSVSLNLWELPR